MVVTGFFVLCSRILGVCKKGTRVACTVGRTFTSPSSIIEFSITYSPSGSSEGETGVQYLDD